MAKTNKASELNEQICALAKRAKLESWNSFVEELKVPSEIVPALITMRVELIRLAPVRALSPEEAQALYKLIAGLIETNMALREHAQQVSTMVENWVGSIHGFIGVAEKIGRFAEFRHDDVQEEEDE